MDTNHPGHSHEAGESQSFQFFSRSTAIDLLLVMVVWLLAVAVVRPVGEFPLNDDWSWGLTAKDLAEGKGYHPTGWTEMTLFTHAVWGALFCLPQGFSFTALRFSTLVLALVGVFALYALIRQLGKSRRLALVGAAALAWNPIYFALSNTYMADVPFTTIALLSVFFFVRNLQSESKRDLIYATGFAVLAVLSRQMGLCLPVAFGIALWLKFGFQKGQLGRMILPMVVCLGVLIAFQYWLKATGKAPANTMRTERLWAVLGDPLRIPINVAYYGWSMLMYLGWFLAPLLVLLPWKERAGTAAPSLAVRVVIMVFLVVTAGRFVLRPSLMPVHNNVIIPQGIGPITLRDLFDLQLPHAPAVPVVFWIVITGLSLVMAIVLVVKLTRHIAAAFRTGRFVIGDTNELIGVFLLLCAGVYLVPFLMSGFFDRYLIPVTAFLLAFIAVAFGNREFKFAPLRAGLAIGLIAITGLFAVAGTRDYLAWNRARWDALKTLLAKPEVQPADIDGGFEYNGWYLYNHTSLATNWASTVKYTITMGNIEGFTPIATNDYPRWLPPQEGQILVLKRNPGF